MSPRELLEKLEALGTIDEVVLGKIRKQIENPGKLVKPSAVLKYLVQKKQVTEKQARDFLTPAIEPPVLNQDELEVNLPEEEAGQDTDDLTNIQSEDPVPDKPDPTPVDQVAAPDSEPAEVDVESLADDVDEEPAPKNRPKKQAPQQKVVDADATRLDEAPISIESGMLMDADAGQADVFGDADADLGNDQLAGDAEPAQAKTPAKPMAWKVNKSDQWKTKWLYIGFGILGTILISGAVLWFAVMGVKAEDQFKAAMGSFDSSAFQDAVKRFDEYIKANPTHKDVHKARARRAQSVLAANYTGSQWEETLKRAKVELPPLAADDYKESELPTIREDLSVMLPGSLMHITEAATDIRDLPAMESELGEILGYKEIVDNPVYVPASLRKKSSVAKNLDTIDNNIRMIKGSIAKEKDYSAALTEISQLGEAGETDKAFQVYRKLTRNYGDLAARQELRGTMLKISSRERDLVSNVNVELATAKSPAASAIERSVVLASRSGTPVEGLLDEVVNFLAEGAVYGIDAGDGSVKWKRFVGFETTIQPQPVDDDSLVIVDQKRKDLLRVDKRSGEIIWRTSIGETVMAPAVAGPGIFVTTKSGKVIRIDSQSGEASSAIQLPQKTNTSAAAIDRQPFVYQAGSYSNLYILSADDLSCKEVYYVGHNKNRIHVPPYMWSGHLLVAVNGGDYCDLHVLRPNADGLGLELVQLLARVTNGPVTTPLQRFGRWMFMLSDTGDMRLLELDAANELTPVRVLATDKFDNSSGQTVFALTEGSNMWLASKGMLRYRVQRALGQFKREVIANHMDTFLAPPQRLDDKVFHVRRRNRSGMISASLVDGNTLKPIWRTDLGGRLAGSPQVRDGKVLAINNQGDLFSIDSDALAAGYADQGIRSSEVVEDLQFENIIAMKDESFVAFGPLDRSDLIYADASSNRTRLLAMETPANTPACKPISMGEFLIVPSLQGQIARISPKSGRMKGTPFQPPIKPGTETKWFEPVQVDDNSFAITSGPPQGGATTSGLYLIDASKASQLVEIGQLVPDGNFVSPAALLDGSLFAVIRSESGDAIAAIPATKSLAIRDQANLPGKCVGGPWVAGEQILMALDNDQLVAVNGSLKALWSVQMPNEKLAFSPQLAGQQLLLGFQSGRIVWLNPASGEVLRQTDLGQPIVNRPVPHENKLYFSGLNGSVHEVDPAKL